MVYAPRHAAPIGAAYVVPDSAEVMDTPAEVHLVLGELKRGDRVDVLSRTRNWARVRVSDGRVGWVEGKNLLNAEMFDASEHLLKGLAGLPAQAVGHPSVPANLHLEPSRAAPELALLDDKQRLEIYGRRLVDRPLRPDSEPSETPLRDAWYLVRAGSQAGWVLGRLVTLNVPEALSPYAQDTNLVAWLVLNTVEDEGRQVPQYLVADRIGTQDYDFSHIRVFTWWKQKRTYATAYTESNLEGFFPIRTSQINGIPYFRLRLTDDRGRKFQKIYGLFATVPRSLGIVEGWATDAVPTQPVMQAKRRRR